MIRLHFDDLDPYQFEDLGRQLADADRPWSSRPSALGRSGGDEGYDSKATDSAGHDWMIQCKRRDKINPALATKFAVELLPTGKQPPYGILLIAACTMSKPARESFERDAKSRGVQEVTIWGKEELEDRLRRPENDHLLRHYFYGAYVSRPPLSPAEFLEVESDAQHAELGRLLDQKNYPAIHRLGDGLVRLLVAAEPNQSPRCVAGIAALASRVVTDHACPAASKPQLTRWLEHSYWHPGSLSRSSSSQEIADVTMALGALAAYHDNWAAVHLLAKLHVSDDARKDASFLLHDAQLRLWQAALNSHDYGPVLIGAGERYIQTHPDFAPDLTDHKVIVGALCQFSFTSFLAAVTRYAVQPQSASRLAPGLGRFPWGDSEWPEFLRFRIYYVSPLLERMRDDPELRQAIVPEGDAFVASGVRQAMAEGRKPALHGLSFDWIHAPRSAYALANLDPKLSPLIED